MAKELTLKDYNDTKPIWDNKIRNETMVNLADSRNYNKVKLTEATAAINEMLDKLTALQNSRS